LIGPLIRGILYDEERILHVEDFLNPHLCARLAI
jgi:hypothetical protein